MKYTKEIPTKPGWYWIKSAHGRVWTDIGKVEIQSRGPRVWFLGCSFTEACDDRFEYAGPIEEPEE